MNSMIYDVTDLEVYNRSLKGLDLIYQLAKQIPNSHMKLRIQITSAGEGVPAHIAEGFAKRRSAKEFRRYLDIGMGSSDEVITHARSLIILAKHFRSINTEFCQRVIDQYKIVSKQLNRLRKNWIDYRKHR